MVRRAFSVIFLISVKVLSSWMFLKKFQGFFPLIYCLYAFFIEPGFIDFSGNCRDFGSVFLHYIVYLGCKKGYRVFNPLFPLKLRDCEALPTRLLEGLSICSVQPPMLHSFFNNRVVALNKYWIMITATEILVDPPSVIQIQIFLGSLFYSTVVHAELLCTIFLIGQNNGRSPRAFRFPNDSTV